MLNPLNFLVNQCIGTNLLDSDLSLFKQPFVGNHKNQFELGKDFDGRVFQSSILDCSPL